MKLLMSLLSSNAKIIQFIFKNILNSEDIFSETIFEEITRVLPCCNFLIEFSLCTNCNLSKESWISLANAIKFNRSLGIVSVDVKDFKEEILDCVLPQLEMNPKLASFLVSIQGEEFPSQALEKFNKITSHAQRRIGKISY
jgi:hypothetical protein